MADKSMISELFSSLLGMRDRSSDMVVNMESVMVSQSLFAIFAVLEMVLGVKDGIFKKVGISVLSLKLMVRVTEMDGSEYIHLSFI